MAATQDSSPPLVIQDSPLLSLPIELIEQICENVSPPSVSMSDYIIAILMSCTSTQVSDMALLRTLCQLVKTITDRFFFDSLKLEIDTSYAGIETRCLEFLEYLASGCTPWSSRATTLKLKTFMGPSVPESTYATLVPLLVRSIENLTSLKALQ